MAAVSCAWVCWASDALAVMAAPRLTFSSAPADAAVVRFVVAVPAAVTAAAICVALPEAIAVLRLVRAPCAAVRAAARFPCAVSAALIASWSAACAAPVRLPTSACATPMVDVSWALTLWALVISAVSSVRDCSAAVPARRAHSTQKTFCLSPPGADGVSCFTNSL